MISTKKALFYLVLFFSSLQAVELPPGVFGTSCYNYFTEELPPKSKGIYQIYNQNNTIKYVGSSLDINKRLSVHYKNGLLEAGDFIHAVIFYEEVRQVDILNYERILIRKLSPILNKHPGAPGRSWRSEQLSKLKAFSDHNQGLLNSESQIMINNLLSGKVKYKDFIVSRNLLKLMKIFR